MLAMFGPNRHQSFDGGGKLTQNWSYITSTVIAFGMPETRIQLLFAVFDADGVLENYVVNDDRTNEMRHGR